MKRGDVLIESKENRYLSSVLAKHIVCALLAVLALAAGIWLQSKGETLWIYAMVSVCVLLLLLRGVFWANIATKYIAGLIGIFFPFAYFFRFMLAARRALGAAHSNAPVDYTEAWMYFMLVELVIISVINLLNRARPAFERQLY